MAPKKSASDLLAARIRAVTGGPKPAVNLAPPGQAAAAVKSVRNKRRAERREAFKQAVLVSPRGDRVPVVIKNMSDTGARVDFFSGGAGIVGRAQLVAPSIGLQKWVRVVWKDQNSAGLEFEEV